MDAEWVEAVDTCDCVTVGLSYTVTDISGTGVSKMPLRQKGSPILILLGRGEQVSYRKRALDLLAKLCLDTLGEEAPQRTSEPGASSLSPGSVRLCLHKILVSCVLPPLSLRGIVKCGYDDL